jgi:hypothetical protein
MLQKSVTLNVQLENIMKNARKRTSYERIISCVLFFCSAPQAALLKFDDVSRNHLMGIDKISDAIIQKNTEAI